MSSIIEDHLNYIAQKIENVFQEKKNAPAFFVDQDFLVLPTFSTEMKTILDFDEPGDHLEAALIIMNVPGTE